MEDNTPVKRGRGRPPLTDEQKKANALARQNGEMAPGYNPRGLKNMEAGDNSKYLAHNLAVMRMPAIQISDIQQVEQRINEYLALCIDHDMKPTLKGFCNSLKIARSTLFEWKRGTYRANTHQAVICQVYDMLEALWEDYMQNGKINPICGIFLGKNNFGYLDKQEYVVTPNTGYETMSPEVIAAKYDELPED